MTTTVTVAAALLFVPACGGKVARADAGRSRPEADASSDAGQRVRDVCQYVGHSTAGPDGQAEQYAYIYDCPGFMSDPDCVSENYFSACQCIEYDCKTPP